MTALEVATTANFWIAGIGVVAAVVAASCTIDALRQRDFGGERARRVLNFAVALVGLVALSPVFLLIALAIKLTSRGPVLYTQTRVGLDRRAGKPTPVPGLRQRDLGGAPFEIYKFRTMRPDAEQATGAVWAAENDPRVTAVGRFLRAHRLDELPQLFNVLIGDMNVVGPRPERPDIFAQLAQKIPHYRQRQLVRPGITGHAQLNVPYDTCLADVQEKTEYDLQYISRRNALFDARIMVRTVPLVLFGPLKVRARGASGPATVDRVSYQASNGGELLR